MANAVRAKNDTPDMVYFDDWFVKVPLSELAGKTVYFQPNCFKNDWDEYSRHGRRLLKEFGVVVMADKDFDPSIADYIVVYTGWMKTKERFIDSKQKKAMKEWKRRGAPLRLYWDHVRDELKNIKTAAYR